MNEPVHDPSARRHNPIDRFRAKSHRLQIHPSEIVLLVVVSLHLVFIAWAFGGMRLWAQQISFGLAAIGFVIALLPRNYTEEHSGLTPFRLYIWPKLIRFPLFWLGLAFLSLIVIQIYNPAWIYTLTPDKKGWFMADAAHIAWLPAGVSVPFNHGAGPVRALLIYAAVWLTVCSAWIGFTRRRTLQFAFVVVAFNGFALAGLGLAQRFFPSPEMFWSWTPPANNSFFASFIYKNHAAGYLNLTLAVACGLAGWFYLRGLRRLEKSNPAGLFVFIATTIAVSVLISYARGSTIAMLTFLSLLIGIFLYQQIKAPAEDRRPVVLGVLIIFFGVFLKTGLDALNSGQAWTRLSSAFSDSDGSFKARQIATEASVDMLRDHWHSGVGAGGYRYLFPNYQQHYPEIFTVGGGRVFWEFAHNDWVQFPIEFGVPGILLIVAMAGYLGGFMLKNRAWENPLCASLLLGLGLTLAHARWEFLFYCPAILLTACVVFALAARWAEFEENNLRS
ncbi:MAG: O-antigen ligase family protein [Undibacterium sp.]|nr:O-antigen ligase family protein [Opitutaceae bacterium]